MSCGEWQDLTTKLLWLSAAQIVLFMVAGFLALHWRGQWLNEKRKHQHHKWPSVRNKAEALSLKQGISTDVENLCKSETAELFTKLEREVQRSIWESDEDFSEATDAPLMRVRRLVRELKNRVVAP